MIPIKRDWLTNQTCAEDGGGAECYIDAMDHVAGHAERFCPENANVKGEDRGADEGNGDCPSDLADEQRLLTH